MRNKLLLQHVLAWLIFISYEVLVSILLGAKKNLWGYLPYYILHIALFYTFVYVCRYFVDRFKQWWLLLIPATLVLFGVYLGLIIFSKAFFARTGLSGEVFDLNAMLIIGSVWRGVYFILLGSTYCLVGYLIEKIKDINRLKIQQLESERERYKLDNAYLLSQVNQHLLFNSLNFVYNTVRKASPDAAQSVMILANIMRHSLGGTGQDGKIDIMDEVDHINQLIEISKLRFNKGIYIDFETVIHRDLRFPPLILVTFVENVLKHGDLTNALHPATIYLEITDDKLLFTTCNLKKNTRLEYSTKIGINNAELRLTSAFGKDNYSLSLDDHNHNQLYNVNLSINI
ncbi:sensor histidine kinase [Mucilaginibacter rubeus]|uniref:Signal transduction histidine kinase internal region domain-containing protein n=1 Tax=Mucilaginibacter rubeus TaxID=2027860 RepID=A0A5C1I6B3_9SPHI|nr:histidine kinase [Mucilaginibacter rubeus]QEM12511.1 hypothetical protein DEO27_021655 [Mucilaginibacter rubeus]